MKDNLKFEMQNAEPGETAVLVTATSQSVTAVTRMEAGTAVLGDLQEQIREFLSEEDLEAYWESDVPGLGIGPCVSLRLLPRDCQGNVNVEVYLELNDGGDFSRHSCCFYVVTTRSDLKAFSDSLGSLVPGKAAVLNRD